MKQVSRKPENDYNPAMPEEHGDGRISDEQSGNIGMQDAVGRGVEDADRTRPVDIDPREPHNPEPYADSDQPTLHERRR